MKEQESTSTGTRGNNESPAVRYTDSIAARQDGETDRLYARRVIDELPVPDPAFLPDEPWSYFVETPESVLLPVELFRSSKPSAETAASGITAQKRLAAARDGVLTKRAPIEVVEHANGTYVVRDGNSTLIAAQGLAWKQLPVRIVRNEVLDSSEVE